MKKALYTVLSILSIVYIAFLVMFQFIDKGMWTPNFPQWFATTFDLVVKFGGVAIIFCFALVNFSGSPLKTVFFILLILAIVAYVIVLAAPQVFENWFHKTPSEGGSSALMMMLGL